MAFAMMVMVVVTVVLMVVYRGICSPSCGGGVRSGSDCDADLDFKELLFLLLLLLSSIMMLLTLMMMMSKKMLMVEFDVDATVNDVDNVILSLFTD